MITTPAFPCRIGMFVLGEGSLVAAVLIPSCSFREATVVEVLGAGAAVRCSDGNTYVFGNIDRGGAFACPATGWILYTPPRPCRFKDGPGDAYIWPVAGRGRIPHEQFDRHYRALRAADHTESILNAEPFAPPPSHSLADRCLRVLTSAVDRAADPQAMLTFPLPEAQLAVLATAIRLYAPPPKRGSKRVREQ